jgi:hypothetical protein
VSGGTSKVNWACDATDKYCVHFGFKYLTRLTVREASAELDGWQQKRVMNGISKYDRKRRTSVIKTVK